MAPGPDREFRRVALITGVSRASGIAAAVARRLAPSHDLMLTGLAAYDAEEAVGGEGAAELIAELRGLGARAEYVDADLSDASVPASAIAGAVEDFGRVDALVAAHAHSTTTPLGSLDAEEIDRHLIVNVRATLLLVEAFARAHDSALGQGRVVLFTVNALNPGPTDTGRLSGEDHEAVRSRFPGGRWGTPDDAARAVAWLTSADGSWVTGQILDSEGGYRRGSLLGPSQTRAAPK
jgi:3-oxoacyl-[acyl-carrier protein] reductase